MHFFLLPYLTVWKPLAYAVLALGMVFEGDLVLFSAAFLLHQGYFTPLRLGFAAGGGLFIGEIFWYQLGILAAAPRFRPISRWVERITARFDQHLADHTTRTLFISKFMYGFGHLMMMRAGMLRLPTSRFIKKDVLATVVWALIVGGLGYLSAAPFLPTRHYLRFTEEALVVALLLFLFLESLLRWISENLL